MPAEERVLCFERKLLDDLGSFQGLSFDVEKYLPVVTNKANLIYRLRSEAESNPQFKQLIPYVLIINDQNVLRYQRGKGGEETRLHGLYSIGIGGHIADVDGNLFDAAGYNDGMWREVKEEVDVEQVKETAVAVINDDSTEVGTVHFGVVHVMRVASEHIVGRRKGILAPEFVPLSKATENKDSYESWSRLCLEKLDALLAKAAAAEAGQHSHVA